MKKAIAMRAALDAGREAAAEKVGSKFDIANDAYRGAYVRKIREAMAANLTEYPELGAYTDTHFDVLADLAAEDGFEIGIFDRSSRRIVQSAFIQFDEVDFVIGQTKTPATGVTGV